MSEPETRNPERDLRRRRRLIVLAAVATTSVALLPTAAATGQAWADGFSPSGDALGPVVRSEAATVPTGADSALIGAPPLLPELTEDATLSDYLTYAAVQNPALRAAHERWKAALERVPQARSLPEPKLSYAYYLEEVETRVGPQRQRFGITQVIPWMEKLGLRGRVAEGAANVEGQRLAIEKQKLFFQVKRLYHEYIYLHEAISIAGENVQLLTHLEAVARARYKSGSGLQSALLRIQLELEKAKDRLEHLLDMKHSLAAQLNAALSRPANAPLPKPKASVESSSDGALEVSPEQLSVWLTESNPELRAIAFRVGKEETAVRLAGKNYFPDFAIGVQYIDTDEALNPDMVDSGKDPLIATVTISLPLWFGKYRAAKREAEHQYAAARDERVNLENRLMADLEEALYRYRDAARRAELYRESLLPMAEQSLEVTLQSFAAGSSGILDLIDVERMLLDLRLSGARAYMDQQQALAWIEQLVGRQIG